MPAPRDRPPVYFTVDVESDCPPYLDGWRGMHEGMPVLLDLLDRLGIAATCFVTGEAAVRFPGIIERLVGSGHELGNHTWSHPLLPRLREAEAEREIRSTSELLRRFAVVRTFRAPYLRLPESFLRILEADGLEVDCSLARYKVGGTTNGIGTRRLAASVTPSFLRLPAWIRDPVLHRLPGPLVLFVHPWEFVDLRRAPIPWDCRAGTGRWAASTLEEALRGLQSAGRRFLRVSDELPAPREAP